MSEVNYVNEDVDLDQFFSDNKKVVLVFSARDWCIPCQRLHPHVVAAAEKLPDVTFVDINVDKAPGIAEEFGIRGVPQVWYYEDTKNGLPGVQLKGRTVVQLLAELND